jgi:hypothetical protein
MAEGKPPGGERPIRTGVSGAREGVLWGRVGAPGIGDVYDGSRMAVRCKNTSGLRVLHRRIGAGAAVGNLKVYCAACYARKVGKGAPDENVSDVGRDAIERALRRAGNRCECTDAAGCHE